MPQKNALKKLHVNKKGGGGRLIGGGGLRVDGIVGVCVCLCVCVWGGALVSVNGLKENLKWSKF